MEKLHFDLEILVQTCTVLFRMPDTEELRQEIQDLVAKYMRHKKTPELAEEIIKELEGYLLKKMESK